MPMRGYVRILAIEAGPEPLDGEPLWADPPRVANLWSTQDQRCRRAGNAVLPIANGPNVHIALKDDAVYRNCEFITPYMPSRT